MALWPSILYQPVAGGSEPRPSVLSCPDTLRVVGTGKDTCPRGATYPATCPSWLLTRAGVVGGPRGPGPCWDHAFHPLGFGWVVKAQEGGLAQTQHAACRESTHLRQCRQGHEATPAATLASLLSALQSHACLDSHGVHTTLTPTASLQRSPEMGSTAHVRIGKAVGTLRSPNWSPTH